MGQGRDVAEDGAAVVIAMFGDYASSVSVTLPKGTSADEAQAVIGRISQATGWNLNNIAVRNDRFISVEAQVGGLFPVQFAGVKTITPIVMSLSDSNKLFIAFIGTGNAAPEQGDFTNQYMTVEWTQGGSVHSYQVTVTDHSFTSEQQLATPAASDTSAQGTAAGRALSPGILLLLFAAALAAGGAIYILMNRVMKRRTL